MKKKLESHFIQECRLSKLYSEAGQMNSTEETEKTFKGLERNFNGKSFKIIMIMIIVILAVLLTY